MRNAKTLLFALAGLAAGLPCNSLADKNVLYIFDASGSMWGQMAGRTKIEIAREVFGDQIPSLAKSDIRAGLIVYGHRRKGDCDDIEQLVDIKPIDERELVATIDSITPKGKTPIASSIRLATEQLRAVEERASVVLISDGQESCEPDPCKVVKDLRDAGIDFVLHVIGFDVGAEERRQLQCLAREGGGRYVGASNAAELTTALATVAPAEPIVVAQENIQIILDRSAKMAEAFDGKTRLSAAVNAVADVLDLQVPDRDNLALRSYGLTCSADNITEPLVPFRLNNVPDILDALGKLEVGGEPTLFNAVKSATEDFRDERRFPKEVSRRVVIITGGDYCDPMTPNNIHAALERRKIIPDFYLIGMDLPPDRRERIKWVAGAAGGWFHHVTTEAELNRILKRIIEIEPVINSIKRLTEILNAVTGHINDMHYAVRDQRYEEAEDALAQGSDEMGNTALPFADLGKRRSRSEFSTLYELATMNRELQNEMLRLSGDIIDYAKAADNESFNDTIKKINGVTSQFNTYISKINNIMAEL